MKGLSAAVLASDSGVEMRRLSDELVGAMDIFERGLMEVATAAAAAVAGRWQVAGGLQHTGGLLS